MASKTKTIRLGEETDTAVACFAERLGVPEADVHRAGIVALDENTELQDALRALSAARAFLDEPARVHGRHARLHLEVTEPPSEACVELRGLGVPLRGTEVHGRRLASRLHFDLYDAQRDVTIASAFVADENQTVIHLAALRQRLAGLSLPRHRHAPYAHFGRPRC